MAHFYHTLTIFLENAEKKKKKKKKKKKTTNCTLSANSPVNLNG